MINENELISQISNAVFSDLYDPGVKKLAKILKFVSSETGVDYEVSFHKVKIIVPASEIIIKPYAEVDIRNLDIDIEISWLGADRILEPYHIFVKFKFKDSKFTIAFKGYFKIYNDAEDLIIELEPKSLLYIFNY